MSILEDVINAANDITAKRDQLVADATKVHDLVSGPASGSGSTVDLGAPAGIVKTPARVLAETEETLLSGLPAGVAFVIDFDGATSDADPGAGKFRLGSATQENSTVIRVSKTDAFGADISGLLAELVASTSIVKGHFRLTKIGDKTRWLAFRVTASQSLAGYVNLTIANVGFAASNPFAPGDRCVFAYRVTGDKGSDGAGSGDVVSDDTVTVIGNVLAYSTTNKHVAGKAVAELIAGAAFGPFSNVPLAATTDISATNTVCVAVTAGSGPVTSFGTAKDNWLRIVRADVPFTIMRDATNLETPNQADVNVVAGDFLLVARNSALASGKTRVLAVFKGDGRAYRGPNLIPENIAYAGVITPPQITADQNDYAPAGNAAAYLFRLSSDASRTLTGLAGGTSGREIVLQNVGANPIVLADESSASAAANRFSLGGAITLAAGKSITLIYDAAASRWRPASIVLPFGALATLDRITNIDQSIALSGVITPATITANQNDYNPAGMSTASVLRLVTDAARTLTGLAGGSNGRLLCLVNAGNNSILLSNEDTNSAAANRFLFGANLTLSAGQAVMLIYDAGASRWRALAASGASGGGGGGVNIWGVFNARLTPSTGVAVVRTAVAGATTLYLTAYNGGQIGLYDGSAWNVRTLGTDKSVKLTDTQTCTLTNGNATITVPDASQLAVGFLVSGTGIPANTIITTLVSNTQVTINNAPTITGTSAITFKAPANTGFDVYVKDVGGAPKLFVEKRVAVFTAPAFAVQDGVVVKNGDPTMRHAGAFMTANTDGTLDYMFSGRYRFPIWNRDNPVHHQHVEAFSASGTWYLSLATLHIHSDVAGGSGNSVVSADYTGTYYFYPGGSGGRSLKRIDASALGASVTVTVGAANGSSSFGAFHSATGGTSANYTSGVNGSGSGGDVNFTGCGAPGGLASGGWVIVSEAVER